MAGIWAVVPAAGRGSRFGGERPKQYLEVAGRPLLAHTLDALLAHPGVAGVVLALAADDPLWPGWHEFSGRPLLTCVGGDSRAGSVLAALQVLPDAVRGDDFVLVHDAARPNLALSDLEQLLERGRADPVGAILAAPVRDTLKRSDADTRIARTEPRDGLWRALTPQAFHRDLLLRALKAAQADGVVATDEAMAVERLGLHPALVEGREDNLKVTTPADLALAEFLLGHASR